MWQSIVSADTRRECWSTIEEIEQGLAAVRALEVGDSVTHLEGFLLEGGRVCFTDATLRPTAPGPVSRVAV